MSIICCAARNRRGTKTFVKDLAANLSLPCYVKRVDVKDEARRAGKSLQHAGRDIRYRFFDEIAEEHRFNKIAIAHNLDDQVETFLLRIVKGTGMRGLSSIPTRRGMIIRPFLTISRREIEAYAKARGIRFVEDSSNAKIVYERNFIRREILPLMEQLNPAVREKIFSLLQDMTAMNKMLDREAEVFLREEMHHENEDLSIRVEALRGLEEETRYRVLSSLLQTLAPAFIPLREHIRLIEKVVSGDRPSAVATLPHDVRARRIYGNLIITRKRAEPPVTVTYPVQVGKNRLEPLNVILSISEEEVPESDFTGNKNIAFLDRDKLGELSVRTFVNGDRFVPLGMSAFTKVKDFFISQKVPRETRRRIPLLLSGKEIVWIIGHRIDERFKVKKETQHVLKTSVTVLTERC